MSNTLIIAIYSPFALVTTAILVVELLRRFKRKVDYLFTLLCVCAVCWFYSDIAGILSKNEETAIFFIKFILIFVGFIPPILLLFVLNFYKVPYQPPPVLLLLMFIIPALNIVMTTTTWGHMLVTARLDIISLEPIREVALVWGPWFWVHTAYSYVISMILISVIMFRHFRMPRFYRTPSTLVVVGVSLTLLGNVATILQLVPAALDPTLIATSLSLIFFNLAIINNNNSKFSRFSYRQIYHFLDIYILVLDENRRVVDCNRSALEWFSAQGIGMDSTTLDDITDALLQKNNAALKSTESEEGVDIHVQGSSFPVILNLRTHVLSDATGDIIGSIAIFTDVTQNRLMLERLEAKAGMDSLTGLPNHMAYAGAKKRLDTPGFLPLSVIMCDANGLKDINDNLGHQFGDMMLQVMAEVLEKACPPKGFVARIGGDEFIFLLPHATEQSSITLMAKIKQMLTQLEGLPFKVSAALGTAAKFYPEENLDDVIALADNRMYEDKRQEKARSAG